MSIHDIAFWTKIDNIIATDFKATAKFVAELRKGISEDGHIICRHGKKRRGSKMQTPKLAMITTGKQL
jgi:hypothetical protein